MSWSKGKILLFVTLLFFVIIVFALSSYKFEYANKFKEKYSVFSLSIPEKLDFAGEQVPLNNFDVKESLDRELHVNTYWQSQTILFIKRANRYFPEIEPILKEEGLPLDFKYLALAAIVGFCFTVTAPKIQAQVNVEIGVAPDCPYGYYDAAPYGCAPYGYYGSEWFTGGLFVGAGPWFHGSNDFQGHVDNTFDPHHGYSGHMPKVGEKAAAQRRRPEQFKGNETRDGRGHTAEEKRK